MKLKVILMLDIWTFLSLVINYFMINSTFAAIIEVSAKPEDTPEIKNTNLHSGFILTLSRCT